MKILAVAPSLNIGGIGRHLLVFAKQFVADGHEVSYISCINHDDFYEVPEGLTVLKPSFNNMGRLARLLYYPRIVNYFRKTIRKEKPDFVIVFGELFNPLVLLASKGLKVPVFIGDMTSADYDFGRIKQFLRDVTYTSSAGLVCQTQFAEDFKKKQFGPQLNTIALDNPIREVKVDSSVPKEKVILYVGRFAWEKAPERLIEAFAKLENREDWKLVMCGDGPLLNENKALAERLNVANRVNFLGKVKDVDYYLSLASIYVLPSTLEGFPNALAEAMIAGLPVIVFDGFPSHEIVNNGRDGVILPNGDIEALAKTIEDLIRNPEKRNALGMEAAKIRLRLNPKTVSEKLFDFIEATIEKKV